MLAALGSARRVTFAAFVLPAGSPVERALEQAARRGAHVRVRLDTAAYGLPALARANARTLEHLRAAGADAQPANAGLPMHLKAAVCDRFAYLDDCNFLRSGDTVVCDDTAAHVRAVRAAIVQGRSPAAGRLSLEKRQALLREAAIVRSAKMGDGVDVESEFLHACAVTSALRTAAANGAHCRVLVSNERKDAATLAAAASLRSGGVDVRFVRSNEKFAIAGSHTWLGSADATSAYGVGDRIDWGMAFSSAALERRLEARFEARWSHAKALDQTGRDEGEIAG